MIHIVTWRAAGGGYCELRFDDWQWARHAADLAVERSGGPVYVYHLREEAPHAPTR